MSAFYLDSSALVKRYSTETGSKFVINLMQPSARNRLYSVKITEVEVCAALIRKRKSLKITAVAATKSIARFRRNFAARFVKSDITDALIIEAIRLSDLHTLRGYDAIQLAAALEANSERISLGLSSLTFVSADTELNTAAIATGLAVENPNNYP